MSDCPEPVARSASVRCQPFSWSPCSQTPLEWSEPYHARALVASTGSLGSPWRSPPIFLCDAATASGSSEASPERVMRFWRGSASPPPPLTASSKRFLSPLVAPGFLLARSSRLDCQGEYRDSTTSNSDIFTASCG